VDQEIGKAVEGFAQQGAQLSPREPRIAQARFEPS